MSSTEEAIASVFRELKRSGHVEALKRVVRDAATGYRIELDALLMADLLTDEAKRAHVYALQGQMKTCVELLATFDTLAQDHRPTADA